MENKIENKLIQLLQTQYELENVSLDFLREGGCTTYLVNGEKKYLLKVIGNAFKDTAKQSVMITRFLEEKSFPVPKTILTKAGEAIVEVSDDDEASLVLLQEFIEGEEPDLEKSETAQKVGELVGKLHSLMKNCPVQLVVRDKQFFIGRYLDFLRQKAYPKITDYEKLGERLWNKVQGLPYGICHGDLHRGNLLQTKDGQIYFLDFDTVCQAPLMFDVMVMCDMTNYFNLQQEDIEITRTVYKNFISGYTRHHPLSAEEKLSFYDWVAIRHFQLQATILEVHGINCIDEKFIDYQLYWLNKWMELQEK